MSVSFSLTHEHVHRHTIIILEAWCLQRYVTETSHLLAVDLCCLYLLILVSSAWHQNISSIHPFQAHGMVHFPGPWSLVWPCDLLWEKKKLNEGEACNSQCEIQRDHFFLAGQSSNFSDASSVSFSEMIQSPPPQPQCT